MHIDIVDFFLQGSKSLLTTAAAFYAPLEQRPLVTRVTTWLLAHQFVDFGALAEVFAVRSGTGMGSRSSGCLANAGFRYDFERRLLGMFETFGVLGYVRYVDNLLFHVSTHEHACALLAWVRSSSDVYSFTLEHLDFVSSFVVFTDFCFRFNERTCQLETRPILKDRGAYISFRSAHVPTSIHSWTAPYFRHLAFLCSSAKIWRVVRQNFLEKLGSDLPNVCARLSRMRFVVPLPQVSSLLSCRLPCRFFLFLMTSLFLWFCCFILSGSGTP
jgi:hypothetical protein